MRFLKKQRNEKVVSFFTLLPFPPFRVWFEPTARARERKERRKQHTAPPLIDGVKNKPKMKNDEE
jgi:hypothetical protein